MDGSDVWTCELFGFPLLQVLSRLSYFLSSVQDSAGLFSGTFHFFSAFVLGLVSWTWATHYCRADSFMVKSVLNWFTSSSEKERPINFFWDSSDAYSLLVSCVNVVPFVQIRPKVDSSSCWWWYNLPHIVGYLQHALLLLKKAISEGPNVLISPNSCPMVDARKLCVIKDYWFEGLIRYGFAI